jgi:hypothetical protein
MAAHCHASKVLQVCVTVVCGCQESAHQQAQGVPCFAMPPKSAMLYNIWKSIHTNTDLRSAHIHVCIYIYCMLFIRWLQLHSKSSQLFEATCIMTLSCLQVKKAKPALHMKSLQRSSKSTAGASCCRIIPMLLSRLATPGCFDASSSKARCSPCVLLNSTNKSRSVELVTQLLSAHYSAQDQGKLTAALVWFCNCRCTSASTPSVSSLSSNCFRPSTRTAYVLQ